MKTSTHPAYLNTQSGSTESLIKRGALAAFCALRSIANHGQTVPGVLSQAAADIQAAWHESARPRQP